MGTISCVCFSVNCTNCCMFLVDVVDNLPHTDHDSIIFRLNVLPPKQEGVHRILYNYKKADFGIYRDTLRLAPWDLAKSDTVDDWWCRLSGRIYFLLW